MRNFIVACLLTTSVGVYAQTLSNHYQIEVEVKPAEGFLKAHCSLHFVADKATREIMYWMNRAFQPIEVIGQDVDSVWFTDAPNRTSPFTEIHILFTDELEKGSKTKIDFKYEGTLSPEQFTDRGTIVPAWTELSIGALWYPLSFEESLLTYDITLTAPAQYAVVSAGEVTQQEETQWTILEETVTPGRIILMLSDQLHQVRTSVTPYTVDFYVLEPNDPLVDSLQLFAQQLLTFFDKKFGAVQSRTNHMKIFFPNRDIKGVSNGGFSSNGRFIMLSNAQDVDLQFYILSHEIAHFWWRYGLLGNYHEFLSEGLAEFSSLMALREIRGGEKMVPIVNRYQRKTAGIGSIKSWTAQNMQKRNHYLYWKGSLAMLDLLDKIGEEKLYAILQRASSEKVSRYEDFLRIIEEVTDNRIAAEFDRQF